jgi:hypothetical protein
MHAIFVRRIRASHMTSIHYGCMGCHIYFFGHFTARDLEFGKCLLNDGFSSERQQCVEASEVSCKLVEP